MGILPMISFAVARGKMPLGRMGKMPMPQRKQQMKHPDRFAWPDGVRIGLSLTFDDGRDSQLDNGLAVLARHDAAVSFYMAPSSMDPRLAEWQAVAKSGHEIGNHSVNHTCSGNFCWGVDNVLEDYTLEQMEAELLEAQAALTERLGTTPRTFAYPCGQMFVGRGEQCRSYTPIVARHFLSGRGFREETFNDPSFTDLARTCGTEGDGISFERFEQIVARAADQQSWIILACHDIGQPGPRQTMAIDVLDKLCAFCKDPANGIWLDTVEHIADYIAQNRS